MDIQQASYIIDITILAGYHFLYNEGLRFKISDENIKMLDIKNATEIDIKGNKKIRTWNPIIFPKGTISFRTAKSKDSIENSTLYNKVNQPRFYSDIDVAIKYLPNNDSHIKDNDIHMVMFDEMILADISSFAYQVMIEYNDKIKKCIDVYLNNGKFQEVIQKTGGINPHNLLFGESGYPIITKNERNEENQKQYISTIQPYAKSIYQELVPIVQQWSMNCGIGNLNIKNIIGDEEISENYMDIEGGNSMEAQDLSEKFVNKLLNKCVLSSLPINLKESEDFNKEIMGDDDSGIMYDGFDNDPTEMIQYLSFYITYGVCPISQLETVMKTYNFIVRIFKRKYGENIKIGTRDVEELDIENLKTFGGLNDLFFSDESCKESQRDPATGLLSSISYRFSINILDDIACDFLSQKASEFGIDGYYSYDQPVPWGPNRDHGRNEIFHFHPEICVFKPSEKVLQSVPLFNMAKNGYSLLPEGISYYSDVIPTSFLKNQYINSDTLYSRLQQLYTTQTETKMNIFQPIIRIHYIPVNTFNVKLENPSNKYIIRQSSNYPNNLVQNMLCEENIRLGGKNKERKNTNRKKDKKKNIYRTRKRKTYIMRKIKIKN